MNQGGPNRRAICVFSGLSGRAAGGVQESGRIAWKAIVEYVRSTNGSAAILVYGEAEEADLRLGEAGAIATCNRWNLLAKVFLRRWKAPVVCFWHLDLLRMLPFMGVGRTEKAVFLHGVEAWRKQSWLTRTLLGRMDRFLTNTSYTWEQFLSYQPQLAHKQHCLVWLGVGKRYEGDSPPTDMIPTVLMLGRLARGEDYKGHRQIIAAWPRILERIPGAHLWIAGDGDLRPDLVALAERCGVTNSVQFWGWVTEEKKQELLQRSRCLAMPSRGEGFGMVYLEAMRIGRPCLISPFDAAKEVVDPPVAGLAVDPDQPEPLVDALVRLMTDGPEWQRMSRDARARYEKEFTEEKFQSRVVDALFKPNSGNI